MYVILHQMRGVTNTKRKVWITMYNVYSSIFFTNNNLLATYNTNQRRVLKTKSKKKRGKFHIQTFKLYQQQYLVGRQYVTTGGTNCSYRQQYVTTGGTNCSYTQQCDNRGHKQI
jgi:hypothetical protein